MEKNYFFKFSKREKDECVFTSLKSFKKYFFSESIKLLFALYPHSAMISRENFFFHRIEKHANTCYLSEENLIKQLFCWAL